MQNKYYGNLFLCHCLVATASEAIRAIASSLVEMPPEMIVEPAANQLLDVSEVLDHIVELILKPKPNND